MHDTADTDIPTKTNKKRRFKLTDILLFVIFTAVVVLLVATLVNQLSLRHEVNSARITTDQLIAAMEKQDAPAARKLGDATFQAQHNTSQLSYIFDQAKTETTGNAKVVKQTVNNGKVNKVVSVYYGFTAQKPYYVRVTVYEQNGTSNWHVINFSGNASLTSLTK